MKKRIAYLVAQLVPGEKSVRILPAGKFRSSDGSGRPADAPAWHIDALSAAAVIESFNAHQSRPVVDYEHQTLAAAKNGQPAPASGWISALEWRRPEGAEQGGLYATIEWTERAAAMIAAGEYRYISPVFPYDETGKVLGILCAGLTNKPGLDGLTDLAALSALFTNQEEPPMDELMERLCYLLNLPLTTTRADMLGELDKLKAMVTSAGTASLTAYLDASTTQIAALKAAVPDPAKFVPVSTMQQLQGQVAALTAKVNGNEVDGMISAALADGSLLPAQEAWARDLGATNIAALKGYLDTAPKIAALTSTQTAGATNLGAAANKPTDAEAAVCKALGLTPEQFAAGK